MSPYRAADLEGAEWTWHLLYSQGNARQTSLEMLGERGWLHLAMQRQLLPDAYARPGLMAVTKCSPAYGCTSLSGQVAWHDYVHVNRSDRPSAFSTVCLACELCLMDINHCHAVQFT